MQSCYICRRNGLFCRTSGKQLKGNQVRILDSPAAVFLESQDTEPLGNRALCQESTGKASVI